MRTLKMQTIWDFLLKRILFKKNVEIDEVIYNPHIPEEARFLYFKNHGKTEAIYLLEKPAKRVKEFIEKICKRKDLELDHEHISDQDFKNLGFDQEIKRFFYIPNNGDTKKAFVLMYVDGFFIIQDRIHENKIHLTPYKYQASLWLQEWEEELFLRPSHKEEEWDATKRMVQFGFDKILKAA